MASWKKIFCLLLYFSCENPIYLVRKELQPFQDERAAALKMGRKNEKGLNQMNRYQPARQLGLRSVGLITITCVFQLC